MSWQWLRTEMVFAVRLGSYHFDWLQSANVESRLISKACVTVPFYYCCFCSRFCFCFNFFEDRWMLVNCCNKKNAWHNCEDERRAERKCSRSLHFFWYYEAVAIEERIPVEFKPCSRLTDCISAAEPTGSSVRIDRANWITSRPKVKEFHFTIETSLLHLALKFHPIVNQETRLAKTSRNDLAAQHIWGILGSSMYEMEWVKVCFIKNP